MQTTLSKYVKAMRKQHRLTQVELSEKSGVGLRFVRGWSRKTDATAGQSQSDPQPVRSRGRSGADDKTNDR